MKQHRIIRFAVATTAFLATATSYAQQYPTKPITMIVPFAAGGPTDTLGRNLGIAMGKQLKQTIVIENVGGAGGKGVGGRASVGGADNKSALSCMT